MDTELLVEDWVDEGRVLLEHLMTADFQVAVAFWVKPGEDAVWRLYLAPSGFSQGDRSGAHAKVYDILDHIPGTSISLSDITLLDPASPAAEAVTELRDRSSTSVPRMYRHQRFGNLAAKEAIIYPPIDNPLRQEFIVTYLKRSELNEWAATSQWADSYRGISAKGAVSYSTASWLGAKSEDPKFAHVRVLIEVSPELDVPTILRNPVVAHALLEQGLATQRTKRSRQSIQMPSSNTNVPCPLQASQSLRLPVRPAPPAALRREDAQIIFGSTGPAQLTVF